MQYNYDFHFYHQLVHASQMLGEFESFYFNRNVHNGSWYGKPNFLPGPHLVWFIESQFSGKGFLIVLKILMGEKENFCFSTLTLRKPWDL